jgi:predicted transcriptional regulator
MSDRYHRGVRNLRPELVEGIRLALSKEPGISKAEVARRLGVSRATVGYYLRAMKDVVADTRTAARDTVVRNQLELVARVSESVDALESDLQRVRQLPFGTSSAQVLFRGYATLVTYHRLLGELLGQVSPPTTNLYLVKVEQLLRAEISPARLPAGSGP